jgi:hypothetical protein
MVHGLRKILRINSFPHFFFVLVFRYLFDIWYIALPYQDTDQVQVGYDPLIFHKVMALGLRKISRIISFPHFFRSCLQIFIRYMVQMYIALPYQDTAQD